MSALTRREFLQGAVALGSGWAVLGRARASQPPDPYGEWLGGDLHCHTYYSPDVHGGPEASGAIERDGDDLKARLGFGPAEQIAMAQARGLDFLAITDHNNTKAQRDPGYRSARLILIPGYEHSLRWPVQGHVGIYGVDRPILVDGSRPDAAPRLERAVARRNGLFSPTHPYGRLRPWRPQRYVRPHSLEVWNGGMDRERQLFTLRAWERDWIPRRVPAVGGSDHHQIRRVAENGVGQPTTWVRARRPTWRSILSGIRKGRTSVSIAPPALGGPRLLLEAEGDDGPFSIGDVIPSGGIIRVTVPVEVRSMFHAPGMERYARLIVDGHAHQPQRVDGPTVRLTWDARPRRYLRAELFEGDPDNVVAFTSPIWVR